MKRTAASTTSPQERLRTAMAINAMPGIIDKLLDESKTIPSHDIGKRNIHFQTVYERLYREAFHDAHSHSHDPLRTGLGASVEKRTDMRKLINEFADQLFDSNGYFKAFDPKPEVQLRQTAHYLAHFYMKMRDLKPFAYGNELTLNSFIHYFGNLQGFKDVTGSRLDFRRLTHEEAEMLRTSKDADRLSEIFVHALNNERTPRLVNKPDEFGTLGRHIVIIDGIEFLSHEENGERYIVTVNGGLVPEKRATEELQQHLGKDGSVAEFYIKPEKYLPINITRADGSTQRLQDMKIIDGYEAREDGSAPLVCLDADIRTGLRKSRHAEVESYLAVKKLTLHELENETIAERIIQDAPVGLRETLRIASRHVQHITRQIDAAKQSLFDGKIPVAHDKRPSLIISMGGPGSGKSAASELAAAYTDNNYVEASLDKARSSSCLYHVLCKVGHHGDDYALIEPFASTMREWVAAKASGDPNERYNLLFDGTGIDFKPRYEKLADQFGRKAYNVTVCMVDSMLVVPKGREAECKESVLDRIISRSKAGNDQRMLPWKITVDKHRGVMRSFLDAWKSPHVSKAVAFCSDGPMDKRYLLAEGVKLAPDEFHAMENASDEFTTQRAQELLKKPDSVMMKMAEHAAKNAAGRSGKSTVDDMFKETMDKIPAFNNKNISLLCDDSSGENRGLIITNATRMVDVAQKSMFNREASGPSNLCAVNSDLAFLVTQNGQAQEHGQIPLQIPPKEYTKAVAEKIQSGPRR